MARPFLAILGLVAIAAITAGFVSLDDNDGNIQTNIAACQIAAAKIFPHGAIMWDNSTDWPMNHRFLPDLNAYREYVIQCMTAHGYTEDVRKVTCQPHFDSDMAFDRRCYRPDSIIGSTIFDLTVWIEYKWYRIK